MGGCIIDLFPLGQVAAVSSPATALSGEAAELDRRTPLANNPRERTEQQGQSRQEEVTQTPQGQSLCPQGATFLGLLVCFVTNRS